MRLVICAGSTFMCVNSNGPGGCAPTATMQSLLVSSPPFEWEVPCRDTERWPAGDYTIQSAGGEGLGKWTQQVCSRV